MLFYQFCCSGSTNAVLQSSLEITLASLSVVVDVVDVVDVGDVVDVHFVAVDVVVVDFVAVDVAAASFKVLQKISELLRFSGNLDQLSSPEFRRKRRLEKR